MMHGDFDLIAGLLGQPDTIHVAAVDGPNGRGSAATVLLTYPDAFVCCTSSALMPRPYQVRGGWRATFTGAVLEYGWSAGYTGQGPATLTEHTEAGNRELELPDTSIYATMFDHVLACLTGHADNDIEPASALPAFELTLDVHQRLTPAK
jgi:predicted dehydrogenase